MKHFAVRCQLSAFAAKLLRRDLAGARRLASVGGSAVGLWCASLTIAAAQPELIERTLAIVGGQVITLSEVRTATGLGLIDVAPSAEQVPAATTKLIDRTLILREVQRYLPPEPPVPAINDRVTAIRDRLGDDGVRTLLEAGGFSENWLRAWVRDDLRIAGYLDQRFAAAGERRADMIVDWVSDLRRRTPVVELFRPLK